MASPDPSPSLSPTTWPATSPSTSPLLTTSTPKRVRFSDNDDLSDSSDIEAEIEITDRNTQCPLSPNYIPPPKKPVKNVSVSVRYFCPSPDCRCTATRLFASPREHDLASKDRWYRCYRSVCACERGTLYVDEQHHNEEAYARRWVCFRTDCVCLDTEVYASKKHHDNHVEWLYSQEVNTEDEEPHPQSKKQPREEKKLDIKPTTPTPTPTPAPAPTPTLVSDSCTGGSPSGLYPDVLAYTRTPYTPTWPPARKLTISTNDFSMYDGFNYAAIRHAQIGDNNSTDDDDDALTEASTVDSAPPLSPTQMFPPRQPFVLPMALHKNLAEPVAEDGPVVVADSWELEMANALSYS